MDQRTLAQRARIAQSRIHRVEQGQIPLSDEQLRAWLTATGTHQRLAELTALNADAHAETAAEPPSLTVVDADGYLRLTTPRIELLITDPALLDRARRLLEQVTGAALAAPSTIVAVRHAEDEPA